MKHPVLSRMYCLFLVFMSLAAPALYCSGAPETGDQESRAVLPLYFIENRGQTDDAVHYYVKGRDQTLYFTSEGLTYVLKGEKDKRWTLKMTFEEANQQVRPRGIAKQNPLFSYFNGAPRDHVTGVSTFARLVYPDLWPGIDLVYTGAEGELKYAFKVKPGADPRQIRLAWNGLTGLEILDCGAMEFTTGMRSFKDGKPLAYQDTKEGRIPVAMAYGALKKMDESAYTYGFEVGDYDTALPLILDPAFIIYCGYIGGNEDEFVRDVAVDDTGHLYVAGYTECDETTFPTKVGPDLVMDGWVAAFVAKVSADGSQLIYCGYIGGDGGDSASGIVVDGSGHAYVAGSTNSDETTFPVVVGPDLTFNSALTGHQDAFVAKVNPQGTGLVYCGYVGGDDMDSAHGIALDPAGRAYLVGETRSTHATFPVLVGPDLTFNGTQLYKGDAFVARINAQGSALEYCGYIGGIKGEQGKSIDTDAAGNAYVAGWTYSDESTFPVCVGPDLTHAGLMESFVAKVNAPGSDLVYCGYIGGADYDRADGIAVDGLGNAHVTGTTKSDEQTFPVRVGPDITYNGTGGIFEMGDAYVAKVNPQGTQFIYCGYIGGGESDEGFGIAVDSWGQTHVVGHSTSDESSFPVKGGPSLHYGGTGLNMGDAFVARVNEQGTALEYCGYVGGKFSDLGQAIAIDPAGNDYIAGLTDTSEAYGFPVKTGPDLTYNGAAYQGYGDAFVAKIVRALAASEAALSASTGGIIDFFLMADTDQAGRHYFLLGSVTGTGSGLPLPGGMVTLPLNWDSFTDLVISLANSAALPDFRGVLDGDGAAAAQLNSMGPLPPSAVGLTLYFAYLLYYPGVYYPYDFVSNPVFIEILP